jgi:hypothetical protein
MRSDKQKEPIDWSGEGLDDCESCGAADGQIE